MASATRWHVLLSFLKAISQDHQQPGWCAFHRVNLHPVQQACCWASMFSPLPSLSFSSSWCRPKLHATQTSVSSPGHSGTNKNSSTPTLNIAAAARAGQLRPPKVGHVHRGGRGRQLPGAHLAAHAHRLGMEHLHGRRGRGPGRSSSSATTTGGGWGQEGGGGRRSVWNCCCR